MASDLSWISPFASISVAPNALNSAPCTSVESLGPPRPNPKVMLSFLAASAYFRNASQVQASCSAVCSSVGGYIAWMSSPYVLRELIRAHGGLVCVPELVGTAIQWPFCLARYSQVLSTAPFLAI